MCTHSLKLPTNKEFINGNSVTSFYNFFPCGYCTDCIRKKRSEWQLRAYYHAKDLFSRNPNSFVLFDTLTYADHHLKWFHDLDERALYNAWDFPCFSVDDVQKFFKRLRSNLSRSGFDCKDHLDYLLTSEYGTSDGCTHRPHYHILFFVDFDISPTELSRYIACSWEDRTDGIPYKSERYVLTERTIRPNSGNKDVLKLIRYVSKYISKDMYLHKKLLKRVYMSYSIAHPDWHKSYKGRLAFRRFKSRCLPFHRQSNGFGIAAIKMEDKSYIDKYGAIRMPISSKNITASIPLPLYLKRKLYYDLVKQQDGKLRWFPKLEYLSIKKDLLKRSIQSFARRLYSWKYSLGWKNCEALATYQLCYRGKLCRHPDYSLDDLLKSEFDRSAPMPDVGWFHNYSTEHDSFRFGKHILDYSSGIPRSWRINEFAVKPPDGMMVISCPDKDMILDEYFSWRSAFGEMEDLMMYRKDKQTVRYKQLQLL